MRTLRETRKGRGSIDYGQTFDPHAEYLQWSLETLLNTAYIQSAETRFPWLSDVDRQVLLEGARLGMALAPHRTGTPGNRWAEACRNLSNREQVVGEIVAAMRMEDPR